MKFNFPDEKIVKVASIQLNDKVWHKTHLISKRRDLSLSQVVCILLEGALEEYEKEYGTLDLNERLDYERKRLKSIQKPDLSTEGIKEDIEENTETEERRPEPREQLAVDFNKDEEQVYCQYKNCNIRDLGFSKREMKEFEGFYFCSNECKDNFKRYTYSL